MRCCGSCPNERRADSLRAVLTKINTPGTRDWTIQEIHDCGQFHQFSLDIEEDENGFSSYAVAVVELRDGTIITPRADRVQFIDPTEGLMKWIKR